MKGFYFLKRPDLPPELRLILSCLRIKPNEKEAQQIERISQTKISWPDFLRWVERHRVTPLVHTNLSRYAGKTVPPSILSALHSRFEKNAHRSLANAAELVRLYKLLQKNHIPVLPLKGSVLALQVYGNLALRHCGDIDLLVAPHHVELADCLLQMDYRRTVPAFRLTPSQRRRFLRFFHHFEYSDAQGILSIELHWRSIPDQPSHIMDLTRLNLQTSAVTMAGSRLPALSLPDNILYLCDHGAHHFWCRLFWLVDLAEMMRWNLEIDWPELVTLAKEAGMVRRLAIGVILAHELLDVPLPESIRSYALQDQMVSVAAKVAFRLILCPQPETKPFPLGLQMNLCLLRSGNFYEEKLRVLQEIFAGESWRTIGLPDSLFFLYFVLRFPLWLKRRLGVGRNQMD